MSVLLKEKIPPGVFHYIFLFSYNCNLSCGYCFQHKSPKGARKSNMTEKSIDVFFQAMSTIEHESSNNEGTSRLITLFGGEPFLPENRRLIEQLIKRAREIPNIKIDAVTNGINLHLFLEFLNVNDISKIQVTIDGPEDIHNKVKGSKHKFSAYQITLNNIDKCLQQGVKVSLRLNVDQNTINYLPELTREFQKRDWLSNKLFTSYYTGIREDDGRMSSNITSLFKKYDSLVEVTSDVNFIRSPDKNLEDSLTKTIREKGDPIDLFKYTACGAHLNGYIFGPDNNIYLCTELTEPGFAVGKVSLNNDAPEVTFYNDILTSWKNRHVDNLKDCLQCPYVFFCAGGCANYAQLQNGDIYKVVCNDFAERFKHSLQVAYMEGRKDG
jgi:uncharacterized protein